MEQTFLSRVVLPLALFIIMLGMGLSLVVDDFRRVMRFPKAVAVGALLQMVMLPLVGVAVVKLVGMDTPELAVGLIVLALCPGGTTSNMISFLSRGDVALSITLTAIVSAVTPFTIPLFTVLAMNHFMGESQAIQMPIGQTVVALLAITVLPVAIGMAINKRWPNVALSAEKPVKVLSVVFLFAIIAALIRENIDKLPGYFAQVGAATLLLNVATMLIAFFAARALGLGRKQQITIGIEVGVQNGTTALLVTGTLLANTAMTIPPAIYSLLMFVTGGAFGYLVNRFAAPDADSDERGQATRS
jgi:BASS family bile acid:Na+ symporter